MVFKSKHEVEAIKKFVEGEDFLSSRYTPSFADLKQLDVYELADRMESIHNQSLMMTWLICLSIREKFTNNREMGLFIKELQSKNPYHPLCVVNQQTRNRYIHAGRLLVKLKILDFNTIGIPATAFYDIAAPQNKDYADKVFNTVKKKNYSVEDIRRFIEQEKSIDTGKLIEEPAYQVVERIDYSKPQQELRTINVIGGIADDILDAIGEQIEDAIEHHEPVQPISLPVPEIAVSTQSVGYNAVFSQMRDNVDTKESEEVATKAVSWIGPERRKSVCPVALDQHNNKYAQESFKLADVSSDDLVLELATRIEHKSDEDVKADFMMISERYEKTFTELSNIFKSLVKWADSLQV